MRFNNQFSEIMGVSGLVKKLIQLTKYRVYPLIYLFMKLTLFLFVTTANVESVFATFANRHNIHRNKAKPFLYSNLLKKKQENGIILWVQMYLTNSL